MQIPRLTAVLAMCFCLNAIGCAQQIASYPLVTQDVKAVFSSDGASVLIISRFSNRVSVSIGSNRIGVYDRVANAAFQPSVTNFVFTFLSNKTQYLWANSNIVAITEYYPDENRLIYRYRNNGRECLRDGSTTFVDIEQIRDYGQFGTNRWWQFSNSGRKYLWMNENVYGDFANWGNVTMDASGKWLFSAKSEGYSEFAAANGYAKVDGKVFTYQPVFLSNRTRLVCLSLQSGKWWLHIGTNRFGGWEEAFPPTVSSNGKTVALYYRQGGKMFLWVNGKSYGGFADVYSTAPALSTDGEHFGFAAKTGSLWSVYVDGKLQYSFEKCGYEGFYFAPDEKTFCSSYIKKTPFGSLAFARIGDCEYGSFESVSDYSPFFSPDGKRFAIVVFNKGKWFSIEENATNGGYEQLDPPQWSADSSRRAYRYRTGGKDYVCIDKTVYGPFASVGAVFFSADSKRFGFEYSDGGFDFIRIDDAVYGPYNDVSGIAFTGSPDGFWFSAVKDGKKLIRIGNTEYTALDSFYPPEFYSSKTLFVFQKDGKWAAVWDGKTVNGFTNRIHPQVLQGGKVSVIACEQGLVVNGVRVTDAGIAGWRLVGDKILAASVKDGRLVVESFEAGQ